MLTFKKKTKSFLGILELELLMQRSTFTGDAQVVDMVAHLLEGEVNFGICRALSQKLDKLHLEPHILYGYRNNPLSEDMGWKLTLKGCGPLRFHTSCTLA